MITFATLGMPIGGGRPDWSHSARRARATGGQIKCAGQCGGGEVSRLARVDVASRESLWAAEASDSEPAAGAAVMIAAEAFAVAEAVVGVVSVAVEVLSEVVVVLPALGVVASLASQRKSDNLWSSIIGISTGGK